MNNDHNDSSYPNLFIVGAPKCGTTALFTYLKQHPDIFMAEVKEPNYFASDLFNLSEKSRFTEKEYLSLFIKSEREKYRGEASIWYLYSQTAANKIKKFSPNAKIIIMLRDPTDMIYSLHSQYVYSGHENIHDFPEALEAENMRKIGLKMPNKNLDGITYKRLLYREIGKYSQQVQRYIDIFGKENVHIILYDELKKNTQKTYEETLKFLQLQFHDISSFEVVNPHKVKRFNTKTIQKVRNHPLILWFYRNLLPRNVRRVLFRKMRILMKKFNTKYESRIPMNSILKNDLKHEFSSDILRLSNLLNRDLRHWIESN